MKHPYTISSTRQDDRRNKAYARRVDVYMRELPEGVSPYAAGDAMESPKPYVHNQFTNNSASFTWTFKAEQPSEIISEKEGIDRVEAMIPALMNALAETKADRERGEHRERERRLAVHFAGQIGKIAHKRAREACRYDQRLAALHAELDAEIDVQVEKARGDEKMMTALDETHISELVQRKAFEFADRYARRRDGIFDEVAEPTVEEIFGDDDEDA